MGTKPKMGADIIRVADEAWIALALLHREESTRESFTASEILERAKTEQASPELRPGVLVHIYLHNVGNVPPNSATYCMFWKLADTYRLFRPGDSRHPLRKGKTQPNRDELPEQYRYLLDWYEQEYCANVKPMLEADDPVLQMQGVGKEIWQDTQADEYVRDLRSNWYTHEHDSK
jgi:hypothetical protein